MDFAGKVGATVMFSVRLLDGTPEQAAEMVRYTNIEKEYNVRYWSIGNEPTLYDGELKKGVKV
jgi:alpha-L-arabinofuranosidase